MNKTQLINDLRIKLHNTQQEFLKYKNHTQVALSQLSMGTDQLIISLAEKYGTLVFDDETDELIGYTLECEKPGLKPFIVRAETRDDKYVIGVHIPPKEERLALEKHLNEVSKGAKKDEIPEE